MGDRLLRRTAGRPTWTGQPRWTWGPSGRRPGSAPARPGPYQPVPAWVTALAGFTDDRTGDPRALVTSYAGARVVLDLLTGELVGAVDERAHASASEAARIAGEQMIVSAAGAGYLQISDLESGRSRWRQWCGDIRSLATVTLAGRPMAVLTGGSPQVQFWSLAPDRGERIGTLRIGTERIAVLAATEVDGDAVVAVGTGTGRLLLWRVRVAPDGGDGIWGEPIGEHSFEVTGLVNVLTFADWQGRPILLAATNRLARAWDVLAGRPLGPAFTAHAGQVNSVAVGRLDGRPVLWSGDDATVRAWLPETGGQLGEAFRYPYEAAPTCTIAVELGGRPVLVTGDGAGSVWVWDPERPYPFRRGDPADHRSGRPDRPAAPEVRLAVAGYADRPVLLAAFPGQPVRAFDPATGTEVAMPPGRDDDAPASVPSGDIGAVPAPAPFDRAAGVPMLVPGSLPLLARAVSGRIDAWDPFTGRRVGALPVGPAGDGGPVGPLAAGLVDGRRVLLLASGADLCRVDVAAGRVDRASAGHSGRIRAVWLGELGNHRMALTAAEDDTVRLWDLHSWGRSWTVLDGHGGAAYAVTAATVDGRCLVFGAGRNGQVRSIDVTDLVQPKLAADEPGEGESTPGATGEPPTGPAVLLTEPVVVLTATRPVRSLAVLGTGRRSWLVAADGSMLRWQPVGDRSLPGQLIELDNRVTDLVALPDLLVAAVGDGLLGYSPPPD